MKPKKLKIVRNIRLSDLEKRDLFARISSRIVKDNPGIGLEYPIPSPFFKYTFLLHDRRVQVGFASLFILLATSATAYASLDTLPGDLLYGVKTDVVEKIPTLFHHTPESKAKDDSERVAKRIDEFEKLAAKGRLTEENSQKLEGDIHQNLDDFEDNVSKVSENNTETGRKKREDLTRDLESNLDKHADKIQKITEERKHSSKGRDSDIRDIIKQ